MTSQRKAAPTRLMISGLALVLAGACNDGFDFDLRGGIGAGLDTSAAARAATADRPSPDKRGIISYPNYQVAVARRGDTLYDVAERINLPAEELARYNGLRPDDRLRAGEIVALPTRVAEPSPATGGRGVVMPPSGVDITAMADSALTDAEKRRVATEPLQPAPRNAPKGETGLEPLRHKVRRGETAFTIARLYDVTPRALAEWNGLDSNFTIRENQILLIPPAAVGAPDRSTAQAAAAAPAVTAPGRSTPTPTPPSAREPLPDPDKVVAAPEAPDLGQSQTARASRMGYPVDGNIIRPYERGKNNGIDIAAPAGTPVQAARDGKVAAITTDADNVRIVVLRHDSNLMTVYYNVDDVSVSKGANVKRGQSIAVIPEKDSFVHFEVRKGFDSVDPMPYLK